MWQNFANFMAEPFSGDTMSALDWFLFVGLLIAILVLWNFILMHVKEGLS